MKKKWWLIPIGLLVLLTAVYLILSLISTPVDDHPYFSDGPPRPWVIAHQGGDGLWPSNTIFAFQRAAEMGVDVLEMDIHGSADGQLITMHDATVDRTTNGSGPIIDYTLEKLQELDAAYWWSADNGATYPYRDQGIIVPSLDEIFSAFPDMWFNIEIKQEEPSIVELFCGKIEQYGLEDQILVASFHQGTLDEFRVECPEVATSADRNEVTWFYALSRIFLERILSPEAVAFQVPEYEGVIKILGRRFINGAGNRNLEVHAWTINESEDMGRLLDLGVDGIITDYPDRLMALLNRSPGG